MKQDFEQERHKVLVTPMEAFVAYGVGAIAGLVFLLYLMLEGRLG